MAHEDLIFSSSKCQRNKQCCQSGIKAFFDPFGFDCTTLQKLNKFLQNFLILSSLQLNFEVAIHFGLFCS
jgi:hypothetical protein